MRGGLSQIRDIWDDETGDFYTWENMQDVYKLKEAEQPFFRNMIAAVPHTWIAWLTRDLT
jgi:hypothetical protein